MILNDIVTKKRENRKILEFLSRSKIYQDYERAFGEATGLPLGLRPVEVWHGALRGKRNENPFCVIMAKSSRTCAACLEVQQSLSVSQTHQTQTVKCFAGLCDSAVPVHVGKDLLGFLQTGQIAFKKPTRAHFNRMTKQLIEWGVKVDLKQLEDSYFHTKVITPKQYKAMLRLLETFAVHLSTLANQITIQQDNAEPVMIKQAKAFIQEHKNEDLTLGQVAKSVNTSVFYFCKMFKKITGLNFTDYLSRVRIEKAKNLLLNPNLRISEIAFDVGFQSLTHFNRTFLRIVGQSPTTYRENFPTGRE